MKNIPYTKNTLEVREFLESKGFKGLSFFQGKEFVYAFLTTRANKHKTWKEKDYATFSEAEKSKKQFLSNKISSFKNFKDEVNTLLLTLKPTTHETTAE